MRSFLLVLPTKDGLIVDASGAVSELHFERARGELRFEIDLQFENGRVVNLARIDVEDERDFDWEVEWICHELKHLDSLGKLDKVQTHAV